MNKCLKLCVFFFVAGLVLVASAQGGYAQKALTFDEITVKGQAQRPQVTFILQRSGKINLDIDIQRFRPSFSQKNKELMQKYKPTFELR